MRFRYSLSLVPALVLVINHASAQPAKNKQVVKQLKTDIQYLASDELEGRRTGSAGEKKAADYIEQRYKTLAISPYKGNYRYPFEFVNGKEIAATTQIRLWGNAMTREEAFPLSFSANKTVYSEIIPDVMEQGNVWMISLYADKNEADDAHFNWEKAAYEKTKEAITQGATGVLFYDGFDAKYPPEFVAKSDYEALDVPVAFITYKAHSKFGSNAKNEIPVEMSVSLKKVEMTGTNVAAYVDNKAEYTVVIGAHYDHLGYGEDGNSLNAKKDRQIHNGADDNASGTAALMQMAGWLKTGGLKKYNYLFVHFSGEELGLFGSKVFAKEQKLDSSKIAYMINMDMVGRLNDSTHALTVGGVGTSPTWGDVIDKADKNFKISFDTSGVGPSDHTSFYHQGIPVLFFFTGTHRDYHKPSDDAEKINYEGQANVMRYIYNVVAKMDKQTKPQFATTKQTQMGKARFKVTMGIMPDYSYQDGGVRVDGVIDARPAMAAGIKDGDIITAIGDHKISGMQSYMEALGKFENGAKTTVTYKRDGKETTVPLEFK